jgi:arginase family enzyme
MGRFFQVTDFLHPVDLALLSHDEGYREGQIGKTVRVYGEEFPELDDADIVLVGCAESRGDGVMADDHSGPDAIRHQFYSLYYWHPDVKIADVGNVRQGATLQDTYAALKTVVSELIEAGKRVVIIGGSHDLTLAQYEVYKSQNRIIEATGIDALINLATDMPLKSQHFLMEMLTGEPNFIRHYNHIGFQSYLVHPHMLETMDKLRFDCFRVGHVKERMDEMEPVVRNSQMVSIDIAALQYASAPSNYTSPNGLGGEEMCTLTRYCGMSPELSSLGIYGYEVESDLQQLGAKQVAQMIWYFVDGRHKGLTESLLNDRENFFEFHTAFAEVDTVFIQSKRTGRWWMQLPNRQFIACSYNDYIQASSNEIPERWLRAQERS